MWSLVTWNKYATSTLPLTNLSSRMIKHHYAIYSYRTVIADDIALKKRTFINATCIRSLNCASLPPQDIISRNKKKGTGWKAAITVFFLAGCIYCSSYTLCSFEQIFIKLFSTESTYRPILWKFAIQRLHIHYSKIKFTQQMSIIILSIYIILSLIIVSDKFDVSE